MKVSELISLLEEKQAEHGDIEVETVWETYCINPVERRDVYLSTGGSLFIDAEQGGNKRLYAVDLNEGE